MKHKNQAHIKLYVYRFKEDSPRASTGVKLIKNNLATRFNPNKKILGKTIILDPYSPIILSREDWDKGNLNIMVIDRSWNKLIEKKNTRIKWKFIKRKLPFFIASNPINCCKAYKLSSAEAISASLIILGYIEKANNILNHFKWGNQFFKLNKKIIEKYEKHQTRKELMKIEKEVITEILGTVKH